MNEIIGMVVEGQTIKKILSQATILHKGWETDNSGWVVEFIDGTKSILTTSHGGFYITKTNEFEEKLLETQQSVEGIKRMLEIVKQ